MVACIDLTSHVWGHRDDCVHCNFPCSAVSWGWSTAVYYLCHVAQQRLLVAGGFRAAALHQPGNVPPPPHELLHLRHQAVARVCQLLLLPALQVARLLCRAKKSINII